MNEEEFKREFGRNLRALRLERKVTQSEVAEAIGLEPHNLNRIENGKSFPQIKTIIKLINYFNILPTELFSFNSSRSFINLMRIISTNLDKLEKFQKILSAVVEN